MRFIFAFFMFGITLHADEAGGNYQELHIQGVYEQYDLSKKDPGQMYIVIERLPNKTFQMTEHCHFGLDAQKQVTDTLVCPQNRSVHLKLNETRDLFKSCGQAAARIDERNPDLLATFGTSGSRMHPRAFAPDQSIPVIYDPK